jgi:predicted amidophosphoribosyltransferase
MKNLTLAYYRDEVGQELLLFKKENQTAILRWLHFIDTYFDEIFKDMKIDYVVRALGSNETSNHSNSTPLDLMGQLLAKKFNAKYITNILSKNRTSQLKFAGNEQNRKNILDHQYHCNLGLLKQNAKYLIIDDVSTTGTTFNEIKRAISEATHQQADISTFSLVKTLWNKDYTTGRQMYNQKFYQNLIIA